MPNSCIAFGCTNRARRGNGISFHLLPYKDPSRLHKWLTNISRDSYQPAPHHVICSEHFLKEDYATGIHPRDSDYAAQHHTLLPSAVPTVFAGHPPHKQRQTKKRPPPKSRLPPAKKQSVDYQSSQSLHSINEEHSYSMPAAFVEENLKEARQQLNNARKELRVVKQKVKRQGVKISKLLQTVKDQRLLNEEQLELLKLNFGDNTLTLIENELKAHETNKHGHRYSEELKKFAVTLHFYSAQAYEYVRQFLHLPHPSTIRHWGAGLNCSPGFLTEVIEHLKKNVAEDPFQKHCTLMFDAMALKKEIVFEWKGGKYWGFVDCGNILPSDIDTEATEALVFMAVGLTSNWKFPVAYYLVDHLPGTVQAEIVRQLITVLTEAGLVVHGVVCDGSYANQATANLLGCSVTPDGLKSSFPHPTIPHEKVNFIFDACHLIKLVRNCFATFGTIYHQGQAIRWSYIQKLNEIQQNDNLNLANKLKPKHILWQQHKMNVKTAVQALSSSVADAIDFLRDDLHLPQFSGSESTTEFIRVVDKLFDFMNSRSPHAKGFKQPMRLSNLPGRRKWLMETKQYLSELKDPTGQPLTKGRRKTAWVGFMMTIDSILEVCNNLLNAPNEPVRYVCTFKMSQDHLESFFSRIRRRGGWNNNPNCLQFKWALRAILQRNNVMLSKNANISVEEPQNSLFVQRQSASARQANENMLKFAKLLQEPSEFHNHILHYIAGYISKHVIEHCRCTKCCIALYNNTSLECTNDHSYSADGTEAAFTKRKDRGGLRKTRDDVFKIIKATDNIFRRVCTSQNQLSMKMCHTTIKAIQLEVYQSVNNYVFDDLKQHFLEQDIANEDDHGHQLTNMITKLFLRTLLYHHGRLYTQRFVLENKPSQRHTMTKAMLFMGL